MQNELRASYPLLKIEIASINLVGLDSGNAQAVADNQLPLLQDGDANQDSKSDVWTAWNAVWRDVIILDGANKPVGLYNLTSHDLRTAEYYATMRQMLLDAAMLSQKPYTNAVNNLDCDQDGYVIPLDALKITNAINSRGAGKLDPPQGSAISGSLVDTNGDAYLTPLDVLLIVNDINRRSEAAAEGEGLVSPTDPAPTTVANGGPDTWSQPMVAALAASAAATPATTQPIPQDALQDAAIAQLYPVAPVAPAAAASSSSARLADALIVDELLVDDLLADRR